MSGPRCGAREVRFQPVGEGVDIDHRALDPGLGQPVEHVVDQGLAGDLDQGLGPVVGQRPHAGAEAGGQHHGGLRGGVIARTSGGTWRSNQALQAGQRRRRPGCASR